MGELARRFKWMARVIKWPIGVIRILPESLAPLSTLRARLPGFIWGLGLEG